MLPALFTSRVASGVLVAALVLTAGLGGFVLGARSQRPAHHCHRMMAAPRMGAVGVVVLRAPVPVDDFGFLIEQEWPARR
jgi:hypothetical protein